MRLSFRQGPSMSGHSQFDLLRRRRFLPFFLAQATGAFNDNLYKNALIVLIAFKIAGLTSAQIDLYSNLAAGLFILPFFLFSATAGQWAEKVEKSRAIAQVKLLEIAIMAAAGFALWSSSLPFLLAVLFLLGTQSALFGPLKYSILPQALKPAELVGGNALVEAAPSWRSSPARWRAGRSSIWITANLPSRWPFSPWRSPDGSPPALFRARRPVRRD